MEVLPYDDDVDPVGLIDPEVFVLDFDIFVESLMIYTVVYWCFEISLNSIICCLINICVIYLGQIIFFFLFN